MSDDLKKRLIDWEMWDEGYINYTREEAHAYIEELEAKLSKSEALLAKAVMALERIASGEFSGRMLTSMPPQDAAQYFAGTALAELKGETDE
jgi:hypothetical protein